MHEHHVEMYVSGTGRQPLDAFMGALPTKARAKVARVIDLLERFGLSLGPPHLKKVTNHLWELRTTFGGSAYHILLFRGDGDKLARIIHHSRDE
jgi:hypothetical protein